MAIRPATRPLAAITGGRLEFTSLATRNAVQLRDVQLGAIARAFASDDVTPFVEQARRHHPAVAAALGADLPRHVSDLRDLAFSLGLRRASDLHRFVDLGLIVGWPWLQREHLAIAAHMADPSIADVSRRLDALFERVLLALEGPR